MSRGENSEMAWGNVTLADVARTAGVSPITVSRVLNDPDKVKAKTQEKVKAAIREIGYVPNMLAGGLVSSKSKLVIVLVPSIAHRVFVNTIQNLTEQMSSAGYQVLLSQTFFENQSELEQIETILSRRPDAIVLTTPLFSVDARALLRARNTPVVEVWDYYDDPIDAVVGFSHTELGVAMAQAMIDKGQRRVGLIWVDDQRGSLRLAACEQHLIERGVEVTSVQRINPPVSVGEGRKAMQHLIDEDNIPTGVICSNDLITLGAVSALKASGIAVPSRVALIGFGDIDFAAHVSPSLSTFQVQSTDIGKIAAQMLLARLEKGAQRGTLKQNLGFQFEDRETS